MKKIRKSILMTILLFTFVFIFSNAAFAAEPTKVLITQTPTGGTENSQSNNPVVSANGRYVAFESYASNIGTGSSGRGIQDIYVHDRQMNKTEWITHTKSGGAANGNSYSPSISGNGRYVAFASEAINLGPGGSGNKIKDIFVYDRTAKKMRWITHSPSGGPASSHSYFPVISADGTTLAFQSTAKNLGTGGSEHYVGDIYLYNLTSNATNNYPKWITHTTEGKTANGGSKNPSISENGRYVAFESIATNLGPNPYVRYGSGQADIFVYDRDTKTFNWITKNNIPLVTADKPGGPYNFPLDVTLIMDKPGTIYYTYKDILGSTTTGSASNFIDNVSVSLTLNNPTYLDFFGISTEGIRSNVVSERYLPASSGLQIWASPSRGEYYNFVVVNLEMSPGGSIYYSTDGSYPNIPYTNPINITKSTNLRFLGTTDDGAKVFGNELYSIVPYPIGGYKPSIIGDGSVIAFESGKNIWIYDPSIPTKFLLITRTTTGEAANSESVNPSISGDGRYVAFESLANNLGPDPNQPYGSNVPGILFYNGNHRWDIFVYDILNNSTNWVTKNPNYGPANGNSYTPSLSHDGLVLAYSTSANNLGSGGSGVYREIFLEDKGLQVFADKKSGSYKGPLTVKLSLINGQGTIYYTTNGSDPKISGKVYSSPITIKSDMVLKFIGNSSTGWTLNYSQKYVIKKSPKVTVNPAGGKYTTVKTVTLITTDPDSKATTYYTTDGSDPKTSSTRKTYKNSIQISSTTTLRFIAVDPDGNWSPSYKQTYTINLPKNVITISQLNSAAASVRKYYETHSKKLPSSVKINGKSYTMAQLLYLLVTATVNMNTNKLNPITAKKVNAALKPSGNIKNGNIQKTSYISYAKSIQKYINTNGRAPNYVSTSLGKMQFKYMVYMYAKVVTYYVSNKRLPNYVAMSK